MEKKLTPEKLAKLSYNDTMATLDRNISDFLFTVLPPNMKLRDAYNVGEKIKNIIVDEWKRYTAVNKKLL